MIKSGLWIVTKRIKTEVPVNVPLLEIPLRLIKKYEPLRKGNLVFPVYSNQKVTTTSRRLLPSAASIRM